MPAINDRFNQAPGWRKSTHSGDPSIGTCVELTAVPTAENDSVIGVRDSTQNGTGSVLAVRLQQ